jgi:Domain of Unknown Function with PDB structure (DUF3857)
MTPTSPRTRHVSLVVSALAAVLVAAASIPVLAADWPPIAPADLSLTKPRVDVDADAEVLLWDVRVTDSDELSDLQTIIEHHLRIKIFTDRGREAQSKVDLTYDNDARVRDVEGRTVSASGAITELRGQDVFDRTILQASGYKLKAKSFVLPAVTPGAIIEYRWREIRDGAIADGLELPFYREIPVQLVRYHVKPLAVRDLGYQMRTFPFNMPDRPIMSNEERGYTGFAMRNVAALKREPYMPPSLSVGPWMLLDYVDLANADKPADRFWQTYGKDMYDAFKPQLRQTGSLRQAAAEAIKGATTTGAQIDGLVRFVRAKVKRDDTGRRRRDSKGAGDTLSRGVGDGTDQTILFAALASAASLDARLALLPDRSDFLSQPDMKKPYFIRHMAVAVRDGAAWRFVDLANQHAKGAHLDWKHEGQYALLLGDKAPEFVSVPVGAPAASMRKRTVALKLTEDGTVEGDITLEYTGQVAMQRRERDDDEQAQERERQFKEDMVKRLPGAELSAFAVENRDNLDAPYVIRFKLRVPGYGQRAGSRLLVQPALMQRGAEAMLSAATRQYHLYFPFAWSEQDTVTIDLPDGYEIESDPGPQPASLNGGSVALYEPKIAVSAQDRRATYTRWFEFGGRGNILFQPADYGAVKNFLGLVERGDAHTIVLRRRAGSQQ